MRGALSFQNYMNATYRANTDIHLENNYYPEGSIFDYTGDPLRLSGLARPMLPRRPEISIMANFSHSDGYGNVTKLITQYLEKYLDVSVRNMHLTPHALDLEVMKKPTRFTKISLLIMPPDSGFVQAPELYTNLGFDDLAEDQFRVLYTMIESSRIPAEWAPGINRNISLLLVPSPFLVDVFRDSGVTIPISVAPAGIDTDLWNQASPRDVSPKNHVRFLISGNLTHRKNILGAIKLFQAVKQDGDELIIKGNKGFERWNELVSYIDSLNDPWITLIGDVLSDDKLRELYQSCDILLWPSYAEGIGLPPLEAAALGLEVVASDSSGIHDYFSDDTAWLLPVTEEVAFSGDARPFVWDRYEEGAFGNWWAPDIVRSVPVLQEAVEAVRSGKNLKGPKAALMVKHFYNKDTAGESVLSILDRFVYQPLEIKIPKLEAETHLHVAKLLKSEQSDSSQVPAPIEPDSIHEAEPVEPEMDQVSETESESKPKRTSKRVSTK